MKTALVFLLVLVCAAGLCSCGIIHKTLGKKAEITFDANGGTVTGSDVETGGPSDPETYTAKCIAGDDLSGFTASRDYYDFLGWFTEKDGGQAVSECPEEDTTLYAHWKSSNKDRTVTITDIQVHRENEQPDSGGDTSDDKGSGDSKDSGNDDAGDSKDSGDGSDAKAAHIRISTDESRNKLFVTFYVSSWYGQDLLFVDKDGKEIQKIDVDEEGFLQSGKSVTCEIPDRKWMDHKKYTYYIKSLGNEHVDESEPAEAVIVLDGQYKDFNKPIEGSMVWYGGPDEAPEDRAGVVLATDDKYVYAVSTGSQAGDSSDEAEGSSDDGSDTNGERAIYKWNKQDVMINLADVRTDIIYDIYNAYSSRFFPIRGKAMYMDNGSGGLGRYETIAKEDAMHENKKTGQTTFMVPAQWDFAEKIASAQAKARDMGVTLYIVDTFRPMGSVDPVAKAVGNLSLLAKGGTSAHNFGTAVDAGWQLADENGDPVGDPYVKNLQELDKKKAVDGPRGNDHELWWEGVTKLPQEWWHYGDATLKSAFLEDAKRVADLYVNQGECASEKRSKM